MIPVFCNGMPVVTSMALVEKVPHPRSPSRAKRRAAMGHPQHLREIPSRQAYQLNGKTLVMHPARLEELQRHIEAEARIS